MILRLIAKLAKLSDGWFPNYQYSFEIDDIKFFFNFQIFVLHSNLVNSFSDVAFFTQGNVNIIYYFKNSYCHSSFDNNNSNNNNNNNNNNSIPQHVMENQKAKIYWDIHHHHRYQLPIEQRK